MPFGILKQRLVRQRKMRQNASIVGMSKAEIEEKHLSDAVIMPSDCDEAFSKWWHGIAPEEVISVQYPYEHHGLAGRVSNSAKSDTLQDFVTIQVYDHSKAKAGNQLGKAWDPIIQLTISFPSL